MKYHAAGSSNASANTMSKNHGNQAGRLSTLVVPGAHRAAPTSSYLLCPAPGPACHTDFCYVGADRRGGDQLSNGQ